MIHFRIQRQAGSIDILLNSWLGVGRGTVLAAVLIATATLTGLFLPRRSRAQENEPVKIPSIRKVEGGSKRQAFTGKLQSFDAKHQVLNVDSVEGSSTELFPVKKGVSVKSAEGEKLKLGDLNTGSTIVIYYQLKGNRRTVKEIIVLAAGAEKAKKKSPPPS